MKPRKTLDQMAAAHGGEPLQIAGQPADRCPYCGCPTFLNRTTKLNSITLRYVYCRNQSCGKRFVSRQPNAVIVREVGE